MKKIFFMALSLVSVFAVQAEIIQLDQLTTSTTLQDGDILTGTLKAEIKISIAEGATVTLQDVDINSDGAFKEIKRAGITCLGDATIQLRGNNKVKSIHKNCAGISVPSSHTLTIRGAEDGSGSLDVRCNGASGTPGGAAIGADWEMYAGSIVIESGSIYAVGGLFAAAIGGSQSQTCESITIKGGNVTAMGGFNSAGIGCAISGRCGAITISGGDVLAYGDYHAAAIGGSEYSSNSSVTITDGVKRVTAVGGTYAPYSIGAGKESYCGPVLIGDTEYINGVMENPFTYEPKKEEEGGEEGGEEEQGINEVQGTKDQGQRTKVLRDGQVIILQGGQLYDVQGKMMKK